MTTVQLRRLSQELLRLRKAAGLTQEEVNAAMEWSKGRLTYMEQGKWKRADIGTVSRLLDLYGVKGEEKERLLNLARKSRAKGWWLNYRDIFPAAFPSFEGAATMIRAYEAQLVPGLLQTPEYAEAIIRGGRGKFDQQTLERRIEARMERKQIIDREQPPDLWFIVDEAVLQRMVGGPEVMREQIRYLVEMSARPPITIQVLPNSVGAHPGMTGGSFVLLDFAVTQDPPLVYIEQATSSVFVDQPEEVQAYTLIFTRIASSALTPEDSVSFMMALRDKIG